MKPYYQHAGITIHHGDCREIIPPLQFGLVLTDPPFGISHASGHGASWENTKIKGDDDTTVRDEALALCGNCPALVFGSWKASRPANIRAVLIWDKGAAFGMGDLSFPWKNSFEEIYCIGEGFTHERRDPGVIRGFWSPFSEEQGRQHPNQKPIGLMGYLMDRLLNVTVLDPFMGSGTTLRAAKDRNRHAIGIEIEERYCEIAAKRLSQEVLDLQD